MDEAMFLNTFELLETLQVYSQLQEPSLAYNVQCYFDVVHYYKTTQHK